MLHHGGQQNANFHLRPIKFLTTALRRQLSEAVRIQRLGEDVVLNSRGEYNRCSIGRLTLGEDNNQKKDNVVEEDPRRKETEDNIRLWEKGKAVSRRAQEVGYNIDLERGLNILEDNKKKDVVPPKFPPSIYIGESSRSLYAI